MTDLAVRFNTFKKDLNNQLLELYRQTKSVLLNELRKNQDNLNQPRKSKSEEKVAILSDLVSKPKSVKSK